MSISIILQVDEYLADPETSTTNRQITQSYKDGLANGMFIQPTAFPHFLPNRKNMVLYRTLPFRAGKEPENDEMKSEKTNTPFTKR